MPGFDACHRHPGTTSTPDLPPSERLVRQQAVRLATDELVAAATEFEHCTTGVARDRLRVALREWHRTSGNL